MISLIADCREKYRIHHGGQPGCPDPEASAMADGIRHSLKIGTCGQFHMESPRRLYLRIRERAETVGASVQGFAGLYSG
jgi:hypothetical protein